MTQLTAAAKAALPSGWSLDEQLKAPAPAERAELTIHWEEGAIRCEGHLPSDAWKVQKAAWSTDPGLRLVVLDQVGASSAQSPSWLDGLAPFLQRFHEVVRDGAVEVDTASIVLRGRVPSLATKLRCGTQAHLAGENLTVRNYLTVDPSLVEPLTLIAAAPTPVPAPAPKAAVAPAAPLSKSVPPAGSNGGFAISVDSAAVRLNGDLPEGVKMSLVGTCDAVPGERKVADDTKSSPDVKPEPWYRSLPACLMAVSEYLAQGEFRIKGGRATLLGTAKSCSGRDRLLAAVARALPNDIHIDDRTTAPAEQGNDFTTQNIYFNTGSSYVRPEDRQSLRHAASSLKAGGGDWTLLIKGHADSRGDPQVNESLSKERAKAVFDLLAELGVNPKQMKFVGVGATQNGPEDSDSGFKQERRVEVTIVK